MSGILDANTMRKYTTYILNIIILLVLILDDIAQT